MKTLHHSLLGAGLLAALLTAPASGQSTESFPSAGVVLRSGSPGAPGTGPLGSRITLGSAAITSSEFAASPGASASTSRTPGSVSLPPELAASGYQGAASNFGRLVDASGDKLIIADDTEVFIYNLATASFESSGLLGSVSPALSVVSVTDVAMSGDAAVVVFETGTSDGEDAIVFAYSGSAWTTDPGGTELSLGLQAITLDVEAPGDGYIYVMPSTGGSVEFLVQLLLEDLEALSVVIQHIDLVDFSSSVVVAYETGIRSSTWTRHLITLDDGVGGRTVEAYRTDPTSLSGLSYDDEVLTGASADGFGDTLAATHDTVFIGVPLYDGYALDGGYVQLSVDAAGDNGFDTIGFVNSPTPGDQYGRSLAAENGIAAFGEVEANLVPGSGIGAVRLLRELTSGPFLWNLTGEIYHAVDNDFSYPRDYGASLSLKSGDLVAGSPGGSGFVNISRVDAQPMVTFAESPGMAGFLGQTPWAQGFGTTFDQAPFLLEVVNARPFAQAFLILGFGSVSAPTKGGILYPTPQFIFGLPMDGNGGRFIPFPWPGSTPGPFTEYLQVWVVDPDGPVGFAASPGFTITQFE